MAEIRRLTDNGVDILPETATKAVYDENGERLDNTIIKINEKVSKVDSDVSQLKENLEGKINKSTIKTLNVDGATDAAGRITVNGIDTRSQLVLGFAPSSVGASLKSWYFASYLNTLYIVLNTPNERVVGTLYYITISDLT